MLEKQESGKRVTLQTALMEAVAAVEGADRGCCRSEPEERMRAPIVKPIVRVRKRMAKTEMVPITGFRSGILGRGD